jgi:hypothetical protein
MKGSIRFWLAAGFAVLSASLAAAQQPAAAPTTPRRPIYVEDFQAHTGESSQGSSRSGPLSRMRGERADMKASQSAGSLSGAIASEFKSRGFQAQRVPRNGAALPKDGWLVTGIFYAVQAQTGMIQMPSFISGQKDTPNTQVTVSVADLAVDPSAPFIVFGMAEALRGQGPPAGWNPYVVAAKFVVDKVESTLDIQKLAKDIVDTILNNKATIEEKAPKN